jgi:outer membrane receptor protein involved in Fe transport
MVFGQYAYVQGETVEVEAGPAAAAGLRNQAQVDAYPHNFDVGMKLVEGGLTLSGSVRRSAYVQPMGNVGQVVDQSEGYDACADRIREGKQASGSCDDLLLHRLEQSFLYASLGLVYEREVGPVKLALRHAFDHSTYESWQLRRSPRELPPHGNLFSLNWEGYRGGIDYSGFYAWSSGNALVGLAAERRELTGSFYQANQPDPSVFSRGELVPPGAEHSVAGYVQVQQRLFEVLHLNGGLRYDYFEGFGGSFNPRAAITYMPVELVSLKLIYARAFQAPTYFYRMSNPALGYGSSEDLQAETFDSVQAAVRVGQGARWSGEVAYYFNRLDNLISRDPSVSPAVYRNFGKLTVHGVEADGRFHLGMVTAFANYTFLQPIAGETREGLLLHGSIPYVSAHTVNAGVTVRPLSYLSLNTYGSWHSRASAPVSAVTSDGMPARFLLNGTVAAENLLPGVRLALSVHNILGTRYDQGGSVPPFPQAGRWFRLTAEYSFQ